MKRLALTLALATAFAAPAFADQYLQADPRTYELEGAHRIKIEFPVGKFTLEGDDGQTVRVQVRVDCKDTEYGDCQDEARRIRIDHATEGGVFRLEFSGVKKNWSNRHITVEAHVLVPRALAAELNMGVGSASVLGLRRDLDLELGVGELKVHASQNDIRRVDAESGVGDASIDTHDGRVHERGFIGHAAHWNEGSGNSVVRAHVGVGEASVSLR